MSSVTSCGICYVTRLFDNMNNKLGGNNGGTVSLHPKQGT